MSTMQQNKFDRIIIAAYRLPYRILKKKEKIYTIKNSGGLVSAILSLSSIMTTHEGKAPDILWVGTGDQELADKCTGSDFELHPVEIPEKVNEKYYGGFCNDTIWPLFHYFPSRTVYDTGYFNAYRTANNLFFQKMRALIRPGDFVWIHDYQLFLLPEMIRSEYKEIGIGFFLHIPFPSYEIFRLLPRKWREMILSGILGSDVAGFHTNDYSQHFIKSVKRTLGYQISNNLISINDRLCKADAFPIGIDYEKFNSACFSDKTVVIKNKYIKYLDEKKLVFSVDRLDYSKGLLLRLKAFERFLQKYPVWHFRVVFNMVVVPSRDNIEEYRILKKEIEATVGNINGKYSTLNWRPVIYQYKSVPFNELVAIYNLSDVGFITPLRDGMNLVAKEYIACQTARSGMLVLSEMAGASVELNEAIIINPTDLEETADALNAALTMPEEEKKKRIRILQNRLSRYNVFTWADDFLSQVVEVKEEQNKMDIISMDKNTLDFIRTKFDSSKSRLFLVDYDGTLTPLRKDPETALLNAETKSILGKIISDRRNRVVVISGRTREFIEEQCKGLRVTLVAEHGFFIKEPDSEWKCWMEIDLSWKKKIKPILDTYVDRCYGSMIEDKYASLVWHYRNADEDIALLRINELKDDLTEILKSEPKLQVLEGDKVLEVKSILYDKGIVASSIINKKVYDFILAIGDDITDEDLFMAIPEDSITIKVGFKPTSAKYNIKDQPQIEEVLSVFTENRQL